MLTLERAPVGYNRATDRNQRRWSQSTRLFGVGFECFTVRSLYTLPPHPSRPKNRGGGVKFHLTSLIPFCLLNFFSFPRFLYSLIKSAPFFPFETLKTILASSLVLINCHRRSLAVIAILLASRQLSLAVADLLSSSLCSSLKISNEIEENINLATNDSTSTPQVHASATEGNARSEVVSSKPQKQKEPSKMSSLVWDHFTKFVDNKDLTKITLEHICEIEPKLKSTLNHPPTNQNRLKLSGVPIVLLVIRHGGQWADGIYKGGESRMWGVGSDLLFAGLMKLVEDVVERNVLAVYVSIKGCETNVMSHEEVEQHGCASSQLLASVQQMQRSDETVKCVMPLSNENTTPEDNNVRLEGDIETLEDNTAFDEGNEDLFVAGEDRFDDNSDDGL
ncbi:Uncharacterized protein TCM_045375 [Theobroma cacao]|uniref:Uncharacterized protein n=1 Tax=Theobroma cacao TaxID=3641 RepID=A0A061FS97_THECC|nr:Uncharacterized protein TCM_045375 [Theobroma cacao]